MGLIKEYYEKYKEVIKYLIFGVLTTVVNFVAYYLFIYLFKTSEGMYGLVSNILANVVAILFAYFTNRNFVFESKSVGFKAITREIFSFFACRIFSMVIDALIYFVECTLLKMPDFIVKFIGQVVVIILNYVFSKLIVFKKKN